jgi:lipopolysaccharide heptosyltransferase II
MNNPKNLLIVRADRIGDVVLSLPMAGIVKKHYPGCKVTFLLREYTSPLALNHPDVDEVIILKEEEGKILLQDNIRGIKKRKFDACIIVSPVFKTALMVFLSRIKIRIGTGYRWYSFLFNRKIYVHRKYGEKHELEFNIDMLEAIGINYQAKKGEVDFNIKADEESQKEIEQLLKQESVNTDEPVIIIHPGSGGSAVDLPVSRMKELTSLIAGKPGIQVLLTGSKSEYDLCNEIAVPGKVKNLAGKLSLPRLVALIDKSDIFIANSTGPIHIAAALGKHVIGFYPNFAACSPRRWGPYTNKSYIFSPVGECNDCSREQCSSRECMSTIKVTDIFDRVEKICQILENNGEIND